MPMKTIPSRPLDENVMIISIPRPDGTLQKMRLFYQGPLVPEMQQDILTETMMKYFDQSDGAVGNLFKGIKDPKTPWKEKLMTARKVAEALSIIAVTGSMGVYLANALHSSIGIWAYVVAIAPPLGTLTVAMALEREYSNDRTSLEEKSEDYYDLVIGLYRAGLCTFQGKTEVRDTYIKEALEILASMEAPRASTFRLAKEQISTGFDIMNNTYINRVKEEFDRSTRAPETTPSQREQQKEVSVDESQRSNIELISLLPETQVRTDDQQTARRQRRKPRNSRSGNEPGR